MKKKDITIYYGLIMAVYSIGYVTLSAFSSVYLLHIGLSNGGVGILLAIGSLIAAMLQPFVGSLIDNNPNISTRKCLLFMAVLITLIGICITFLPVKNRTLLTALYGINIMLLMLAQPFLNALGVDALNYGYPINLGIGRSLGSFGYALGSYVFGWVSVLIGPSCIPVAFSGAFLVVSLLLYFYPVHTTSSAPVRKEEKQKSTLSGLRDSFKFFAKYKLFAGMIVGMILVYFSHALVNSFTLQIIVSKGGTSADMGTSTAIAAVCELFSFTFFAWYMKKLSLTTIIKSSCVFFTLKILFSYLAPSVGLYFLTQTLQMYGWGFLSVAIIYYVNDLMDNTDKAQGQAYAGQAFTLACVLAAFLGGNIIDLFGVNTMLIAGTVIAAIGTVIVWLTCKNYDSAPTVPKA